jgi:hypothetical protein
MTQPTWGVTIENSALALSTRGVTPGSWLQNTLGTVWGVIRFGAKKVRELGQKMLQGGKELIAAIARGDIGLFFDWLKNDPWGFLAGGAALALGGWLLGAGGAISSAISVAAGGIKSLWAAVGSVRFGGIALGAMLPTLQQAILGGTQTVLNVDWLQSDNSIRQALQSQYNTFLNAVGEGTGRMLAGIVFGGAKSNPKLTINLTAAAALSIQAEQEGTNIQEELIDALTDLANTFIGYAKMFLAKLGLLQFRQFARANIRTGIKTIDDKIANWGLIEGQSFVINQKIDEKIDSITETNAPLGNLLSGFKDGLLGGFYDFIVIV